MKRAALVIVLLIACCCTNGVAQKGQYMKPLKSTKQTQSGLSHYNIGLKLGCPWSMMPVSHLDNTQYLGLFGYAIGITGERNFNRFSIGLEGTFAQKGTQMENTKLFQTSLVDDPPTGTLVSKYILAYNVITIRMPFTWYLKGASGNGNFVPYLFVGPEVDLPSSFNLLYVDHDFRTGDPYNVIKTSEDGGPWTETKGNVKPVLNASAVGGLGFMMKIPTAGSAFFLKFDAAVNYGLLNLSAAADESIHAHDLEVNATILIPVKKRLHDACYSFDRRSKK
ncbi:MAG: hypothetical protein IJL44_02535 [Bacteroidales bacterium]|nr:hypothetical protein [Bacteroidales bacterium]